MAVNGVDSFKSWDQSLKHASCLLQDLHSACCIGNASQVVKLVSEGPHLINKCNRHGWTPLMYASTSSDKSIANVLIENGADVNIQSKTGISALMLAAKGGNLVVLNLLIQNGAAMEMCDQNQWTPLFHAVYLRQQHIVANLLDRNANPNAIDVNGYTPFMIAVSQGDEIAVKCLLKTKRINLRHVTNNRKTARSLAVEQRFTNIVHLIGDYAFEKSKFISENQDVRPMMTGTAASLGTHDNRKIVDLETWLEYNGFIKYHPLFETQNIDLKRFLTLNQMDLVNIGVKQVGARVKMHDAICKWINNKNDHVERLSSGLKW